MKTLLLLILLPLGLFAQTSRFANDVTITGQLKYTLIHATAYAENITYTPAVTQNIYTKITPGLTTSQADGITIVGDSIKILTAGDYLIFIDGSMSGNANDDYVIRLYKNNAQAGFNGRSNISTTGSGNYNPISYHWYGLGLAVNDWISIRVTNITNNNDPTINDFKITLAKTAE